MVIGGDCLQNIKKIEDNSIDLVLIDPPYIISKKSNFRKVSKDAPDNIKRKYDISIDFGDWDKEELDWDYLFSEYYRVLRKGGTIVIFYDSWKSNDIRYSADKNKFKQPRVGIWVKNNPVPINSKLNYLSNAIEFFYTFTKVSKPTFNSSYDNGIYNYPICHGKERYSHPTQKPLSLISDLIEKHSNIGDTVLDTFAGTGTTAHACLVLDRKYIVMERDLDYLSIINKRLSEVTEKYKIKK